MSLLDKEAC